ncbi:formate dehydrogenase subunit delta [Noviherbaspirillum sp.]|jgi:formate dehydrogenase subunit delta|uniref:formate dehydrogenase subunit delta n=1 Tax=Noviherbaspirillum sp. TaxID=1926288 RepID=UPI0025F018CE|nr:formate dehydrogenase subunit delta [Noviherbaspirillum sp.]
MNPSKLVRMANQIGDFFESMPDRTQAKTDIASHLKRFWDPRMRRALLQHIDSHGGEDLKEIVLEAILANRAMLGDSAGR